MMRKVDHVYTFVSSHDLSVGAPRPLYFVPSILFSIYVHTFTLLFSAKEIEAKLDETETIHIEV